MLQEKGDPLWVALNFRRHDTMTLKDLTKRIVALLEEGENVNHAVYDETLSQYITYLNQSTDVSEIKEAAQKYGWTDLTTDLHIATSRRLVAVERSADNLRLLAGVLGAYGPDWDDEAGELLQEADERERE
jgi:hypothetical protein